MRRNSFFDSTVDEDDCTVAPTYVPVKFCEYDPEYARLYEPEYVPAYALEYDPVKFEL